MPELWIPYGSVETLVTVQAENLGAVVDPQAEKGVIETERMLEAMKRASALFICDASPTTAEPAGTRTRARFRRAAKGLLRCA